MAAKKKVKEARALHALLSHLDKAQLAAGLGDEITRHLTRYWAAVRLNYSDDARVTALTDAVAATRQEYLALKKALEAFEPLAKNVERAAKKVIVKASPMSGRTIEEAMRGQKPGKYKLTFEGGQWHAVRVR